MIDGIPGRSTGSHKSGQLQKLSAVVLTLNEEEHIGDCLATLSWADHLLVVDSFSTDRTAQLARAAGADVVQLPFENFAQQRNDALQLLETDWVFFVDADERVTPALATEVRSVLGRPEAAWEAPRLNYIFGRLTRGGGWYPDHQLRLLRHGFVRYERPVHEIAVVEGAIGTLQNPLLHYNYRDLAHFHAVQRRYSVYEAGVLREEGVQPRVYTPFTQPLRHFWWRFVRLGGYRDGLHGLRLSLYMSYYEWLKYHLLAQEQA